MKTDFICWFERWGSSERNKWYNISHCLPAVLWFQHPVHCKLLDSFKWATLMTKSWWHGNASTRKRLNTETDQKLLRDFWIFCIRFPIFIVELFPLFFDQFLHIFRSVTSFYWSVSAFFKNLIISICWSVSSNFRSFSSYFWSDSVFSKNFKNLILLISFLKF